jgi:hypothetical protein
VINKDALLKHPSSYRDPAGFIFTSNAIIYRQVNLEYKKNYECLKGSGLYEHLVKEGMFIPHQEIKTNFTGDKDWYITLEPENIPFISYPYEWSFDMLKDAALLTLTLMEKSIQRGMILKDATPYNIQFHKGKMVFIDTLSFDVYDETKPWIAYRQFCENFLAPLSLMHYSQMPLSPLFLSYPEGVPLQIAAALLPWKTKLNLHLHLHIHLNSRVSNNKKTDKEVKPFSKQKLSHILSSLRTAIVSFNLNYKGTWWNYYEEAEQRNEYLISKKTLIETWLSQATYKTAFDAGANDGTFSELLAKHKLFVISGDNDHFAINELYKRVKGSGTSIHPVITDLSNPGPAIGFNNDERSALIERINVDVVVALAVIHHLSIGKNIPFEKAVAFFHHLGKDLIIEFAPKEDEKVKVMLQQKEDIYNWYTQSVFEEAFSTHYQILKKENIPGSIRTLYLMKAL